MTTLKELDGMDFYDKLTHVTDKLRTTMDALDALPAPVDLLGMIGV